jgi:hydroxymethylbilane synthase
MSEPSSRIPSSVCLGTRASALARWQTSHVAELLRAAWPSATFAVDERIFVTHGDQTLDLPLPLIGGKGVFTAELEAALLAGGIDLAVHSLKDLPTTPTPGLALGAIPRRTNPADVMVSRSDYTLYTLPRGAMVGTSSRRRAAQLRCQRPDVRIADLRGNVDTRLRKALDPLARYDAIVLAHAGLERLNRLDLISQILPFDAMLPAPGQGALGVQCRAERAWLELLEPMSDVEAVLTSTAERAFLAGLGGGCAVPVSSHGAFDRSAGVVRLSGRVSAPDGSAQVDVTGTTALVDPASDLQAAARLGAELAGSAIEQGAGALLAVPA